MADLIHRLYILANTRSVLVGATELFLAGAGALLFLMLAHKSIVEHRERSLLMKRNSLRDACMRMLSDQSSPLPHPDGTVGRRALVDVLISMMREETPAVTALAQSVARRTNIAGWLVPRLASRSWTVRIEAAEQLGFFRLRETVPALRSALERERDIHVAAKMLWAISLAGGESEGRLIAAYITGQPVISSKFNELLFRNLISSFLDDKAGSACCRLFKEFLSDPKMPLIVKHDIIEACGSSNFLQASGLVREAMKDFDGEPSIRIACLRALGKMDDGSHDAIIISALDDPDWRVRAVAARQIKGHALSAIPKLRALLGDRSYHVRMNAALSLADMGKEGRTVLRESLSNADRFVRDVSSYILGRAECPTA